MFRRSFAWIFLILVVPGIAVAAWGLEGGPYDPTVPSPEAFLGRPLGAEHASVEEILEYSRALADASDRVRLERIGESVEGDPLQLLIVTDPAYAPRLEGRSTDMEILRDPWRHDARERREAASRRRALCWIACSIHGDEASGADAGLALAYHLAAGQGEAVLEVLRRSVVVIDPCQNPDGRRRFLSHLRSFGRRGTGPDPSPAAIEHHPLWPGGRRNHYLFDLNRDWAYLTQPESRARVRALLRWCPQVVADLHEMGRESSYFFPPPAEPVNPNVPEELQRWWEIFGRANAEAFDRHGFRYYMREDFDLFYPGYGDSWTTLQGAVGMTYEQATTRGRVLQNEAGDMLEYEQAVRRHLVAAWSTCRTTAANGPELLRTFTRFHEIARERSEASDHRELLVAGDHHPAEVERLAQTLLAQGIRVERLGAEAVVRAEPYQGGKPRSVALAAGSLRIRAAQPAHALLRSLLDPDTPMDARFLEEEHARREIGLRDRFYDVTAWSFVLSHGLRAYRARGDMDLQTEPVEPGPPPPGRLVATEDAPVRAWIVRCMDNRILSTLAALQRRELRVSVLRQESRQGSQSFPPGSLVVWSEAQTEAENLSEVLEQVARESHSDFVGVSTLWSEDGPGLGSHRVPELHAPRIGVLSGPDFRARSVGGIHWLLEVRYNVEHTTLLPSALAGSRLAEFDVLVVPEMREGVELPLERLDPWVRDGGVLVALGSATAYLAEAEGEWTSAEIVKDLRKLDESAEGDTPEDETDPIPPDMRPERSPGAIVRLRLEPAHFLGYGDEGELFGPLLSSRLLRPSIEGRNVVVVDEDAPRAAGFMWPAMEEAIRGMAYVVDERRGEGRVLLYAEDPSFRGSWEGLHRILMNGILLGSSLDR